ncbi:hypothetical protein H2200_009473 [Cladophialophora chaetospira]|uniref:FAD dependent oxidoreductase domain-containing protein n=1 Tax=Cladophialophora chaetospira TaxID=386627 RepID=A0AA38X460_9EURO|nr:hypothetical protein H2200_009473 [Cladophialophora chaetospira]
MPTRRLQKTDRIIIIGAGAFGLSTSLHLALRGYKNVIVFDRHDYEASKYDYRSGAESASSGMSDSSIDILPHNTFSLTCRNFIKDLNKIIRSAYGSQVEYQDLSKEAIEWWTAWNEEIKNGNDLPPGLDSSDRVYINNGTLSFTDKDELASFELDTIRNMEAAGLAGTQLVTMNPQHVEAAEKRGVGYGIDPFRRKERGKGNVGVLDTTGGVVVADKACRFALHKARALGVKFVFDAQAGAFESFWYDKVGKVIGVKMQNGERHKADKVVMACGGWTPSLIPELDGLCETTCGSVIMLKIPRDSPLFVRFSPERFPSWMWQLWDGAEGGLYGFPRDDLGWMKIGYRGTKYTNPQVQPDGKVRSVPITRYTPGDKITHIPERAMKVFKHFLAEYLPEMAESGIDIELTRLCWYTDSFDNHYVVDDIPGQDTVMVATGGSGHAFKYLPNIGKWIVDIMEGVGLERTLVQRWRWRELQAGEKPFNVLMEGSGSARALQNVAWSKDSDLKLGTRPRL